MQIIDSSKVKEIRCTIVRNLQMNDREMSKIHYKWKCEKAIIVQTWIHYDN